MKKLSSKSSKSRIKPLKSSQTKEILLLLADLLQAGFSLQESLAFMEHVLEDERSYVREIARQLRKGKALYHAFQRIGVNTHLATQIRLAEIHGDLSGTIRKIAEYIQAVEKQKKMLKKILAYPTFLLIFLLGMLGSLKWILLPKMESVTTSTGPKNFGLLFIDLAPMITAISFAGLFSGYYFAKSYFSKQSALKVAVFQMKLPLLRTYWCYYYTAFISMEWGKLLAQGMEMREALETLAQSENADFIREISEQLQKEMELGKAVHQKIKEWKFFHAGLSLIIYRGEVKGHLGQELQFYSSHCWEQLLEKVEKWLQWVQPLIFLLIAALIICMYIALLLPTYQDMELLL